MFRRFIHYLENTIQCPAETKMLLAVSGGVDSVVMTHLFRRTKQVFGIAHCNFNLRNVASDRDATFVKALAKAYDVPYFEKSFDTKKVQKNTGESTQMVARRLRYAWFEQLLSKEGFDLVATAHHQNDLAETVLYNLAQGTGIRGLRGITPRREHYIRPLLCFTKKEIEQYAQRNDISFRTDASNESDVYRRNYIRHHIVPELEKINPTFVQKIAAHQAHFIDLENLLKQAVANAKQRYMVSERDLLKLDMEQLQKTVAYGSVLFELLSEYGFSAEQVRQIRATYPASGKRFLSSTHELLLHQQKAWIRKKQPSTTLIRIQVPLQKEVELPHNKKLIINVLQHRPVAFDNTPNVAYFDAQKLVFPLILRSWQAGDVFCPFGMKGKHQKVQDFFSDRKLSLFEKENTYILESSGAICWVVGWRSDERFKVSPQTIKVIRMELVNG